MVLAALSIRSRCSCRRRSFPFRPLGYRSPLFHAAFPLTTKYADPIRNEEMAEVSDALIAFWDGQSRGTRSMIEIARRKGLQVAVVRYDL